jgi:hypothetical protein
MTSSHGAGADDSASAADQDDVNSDAVVDESQTTLLQHFEAKKRHRGGPKQPERKSPAKMPTSPSRQRSESNAEAVRPRSSRLAGKEAAAAKRGA